MSAIWFTLNATDGRCRQKIQQNSERDGRLPRVIGVVVSTRALRRVGVVLLSLERHDLKNAILLY